MTALNRSPSRRCSLSSVHVGCDIPSVLTLYTEDRPGEILPQEYGCVAEWAEAGAEYTVVVTPEADAYTCVVSTPSSSRPKPTPIPAS